MNRPLEMLIAAVGGNRRRWHAMRVDRSATNVAYYGLSETAQADTTKAVWMIVRETADAQNESVFEIGFNGNEFNTLVWNDRATYFGAPPSFDIPVDGFELEGVGSGKISVVSLTNDDWTPVPAVPMPGRKAMGVQNTTGDNVLIQYDPNADADVGILLSNGNERYYSYTDDCVVYMRLKTAATGDIVIEELAG